MDASSTISPRSLDEVFGAIAGLLQPAKSASTLVAQSAPTSSSAQGANASDSSSLAEQPAAVFIATHRVPEGGSDCWEHPNAENAPVARLDPGLGVRLIEFDPTGWGYIRCSNGWGAWLDARALVTV